MANIQQVAQLIRDGRKLEAQQALKEILRTDPNNASAWSLAATLTDDQQQKIGCLEKAISCAKAVPSADNNRSAEWAGKELGKLRGVRGDELSVVDGTKGKRQSVLIMLGLLLLVCVVVAIVGYTYLNNQAREINTIITCEMFDYDSNIDCRQWLNELKSSNPQAWNECKAWYRIGDEDTDSVYACLLAMDLTP